MVPGFRKTKSHSFTNPRNPCGKQAINNFGTKILLLIYCISDCFTQFASSRWNLKYLWSLIGDKLYAPYKFVKMEREALSFLLLLPALHFFYSRMAEKKLQGIEKRADERTNETKKTSPASVELKKNGGKMSSRWRFSIKFFAYLLFSVQDNISEKMVDIMLDLWTLSWRLPRY